MSKNVRKRGLDAISGHRVFTNLRLCSPSTSTVTLIAALQATTFR